MWGKWGLPENKEQRILEGRIGVPEGGVPVQGQMGSPREQRAADFRGADRGSQSGGGSLCRAEGANRGTERGVFTGKGRGLFRLDFQTSGADLGHHIQG